MTARFSVEFDKTHVVTDRVYRNPNLSLLMTRYGIAYNVIVTEFQEVKGIPMRQRNAVMPILLFLLLSGCQAGAGPLPVGTFINRSDSSQMIQLTLDPSQTTNVFIRVSIETGANKYFGKSVGTYALTTSEGKSAGTFVWAKSPRDGSLHDVWFTTKDGKRWEMAVTPDGALVDSSGVAWLRS
jgi:hypothetical protein